MEIEAPIQYNNIYNSRGITSATRQEIWERDCTIGDIDIRNEVD